MTLAPRLRAVRAVSALAVVVALAVPLLLAGTASASTSTISPQDCAQGTIRDKSGQPISKARCEQLVGKQVALANTGFNVVPLIAAGAACLAGAAAFGLRRRAPARP